MVKHVLAALRDQHETSQSSQSGVLNILRWLRCGRFALLKDTRGSEKGTIRVFMCLERVSSKEL